MREREREKERKSESGQERKKKQIGTRRKRRFPSRGSFIPEMCRCYIASPPERKPGLNFFHVLPPVLGFLLLLLLLVWRRTRLPAYLPSYVNSATNGVRGRESFFFFFALLFLRRCRSHLPVRKLGVGKCGSQLPFRLRRGLKRANCQT